MKSRNPPPPTAVPNLPRAIMSSIVGAVPGAKIIKFPPAPKWVDAREDGAPKVTCANTRLAIAALGIVCRYDRFRHKFLISGDAINRWVGELSDNACHAMRVAIHQHYGFDPTNRHIRDAAIQCGLENSFDPILEYLDGLKWDGIPRLDKWFVTYLGAEDTELNRATGKLILVAAVRRARVPGSKFDQVVVLESDEGKNKSTAIEVMAGGPDYFSDQHILGVSDLKQQENLQGKWLYEIADLTGIAKAEVEQVKAFVSRTVDRCRPAYGHFVVEQPRRCVFFATTNEDAYLKSQTGNRRFWPVKIGTIDLEALRRDRDQLWAEAVHLERTGMSIMLVPELWQAAGAEQDKRLVTDGWTEFLRDVVADEREGHEDRIKTVTLWNKLRMPPDKIGDSASKRLASVMRKLGWSGPRSIRVNKEPDRGYVRRVPHPQKSDESPV